VQAGPATAGTSSPTGAAAHGKHSHVHGWQKKPFFNDKHSYYDNYDNDKHSYYQAPSPDRHTVVGNGR
jgi:hypothetical protein